jgi:quercetin dioxygenase-like cupin family protein
MKFFVVACAVMFAASSLAQTSEVEITAEPFHHLGLQNDFVRVFHVEIPPHAATLLHRHRHDYFIVSLSDSNVNSEIPGKPAQKGSMKAGQTSFAEGGFAHVVRNLADTPFPNVDVEVLHPKTSYKWDEERGVNVLEGGTQEILFVKDGVRASETDLQPHAMIPKHKHLAPHLVVAVSDIDLESAVEGQPVKHIRLKAGEVAWVQAGLTHTVMNAGHQNARYIALEFPPNK